MKPITELSNNEIRIEIAEECGWRNVHLDSNGILVGSLGLSFAPLIVPDWAMINSEAIKLEQMFEHQGLKFEYLENLSEIIGDGKKAGDVNATARQRCEAALITLRSIADTSRRSS